MRDVDADDTVDLSTDLLDRPVVGPDRTPLGKVDDLELTARPDGTLEVTALLLGTRALSARIAGPAGGLLVRLAALLCGGDEPRRIPLRDVELADASVHVGEDAARRAASPGEEWLRRRVLVRVPGGGRARG
jgi:hypothetical protein